MFACFQQLFSRIAPFGRGGMPSASGISVSSHAKGTLFEYSQLQEHQLNVLLPLVSLSVLRCAYAPSLTQCPQLSTSVRDH